MLAIFILCFTNRYLPGDELQDLSGLNLGDLARQGFALVACIRPAGEVRQQPAATAARSKSGGLPFVYPVGELC